MGYIGVIVYIDCTLNTSCHSKCIQNNLMFMLINLMCLMTFSMCLFLYMGYMGVMVYMDCIHLELHALLSASRTTSCSCLSFDVSHDSLELIHVPVLVHGVHGVIVYMDCTLNSFMHF
jgi:hypothetical protein